MKQITDDDLRRAIFIAVSRSYYEEFQRILPQSLADALDITMTNEGVMIYAIGKAGEIINWLNYGTEGPYIIKPKDKTKLRFKISGETFFANKVIHPGITARKYVEQVMDDQGINDKFEKEFEQAIERLLEQ